MGDSAINLKHHGKIPLMVTIHATEYGQYNRVKFVIIGGGNTDHLKQLAWNLGIWDHCFFRGFMSDTTIRALLPKRIIRIPSPRVF
jgi:hypothetical protein